MAITETWLKDNDSQIQIDDYNFFSCPRQNAKRGGGVGIYVKSNMKCTKIDLFSEITSTVEHIWLELDVNTYQTVVVGCLYRPPDFNMNLFIDEIQTIISKIYTQYSNKKIVIVGDFNINIKNHNLSSNFLETVEQFGLTQVIADFTRVTDQSSSIIDLIFTNEIEENFESGVIPLNISDHYVTYIHLKIPRKLNSGKTIMFRKITDETNSLIYAETLGHLMSTDINKTSFAAIEHILSTAIDKFAPLKSVRCSKPWAPWFKNDILRNARLERIRLKKIYKNEKTEESRIAYRQSVRNTDKLIKKVRSQYLSKIAYQNSSTFWNVVKKLQGKHKAQVKPDSFEFLSHYSSTSKRLTEMTPTSTDALYECAKKFVFDSKNLFSFSPTNEYEVNYFISKLKNNKVDSKGISTNLIKSTAAILTPFLTRCINQSFQMNNYPSVLKCSKVIPVQKCPNDTSLNNFRPISIQPTFSKIFEKIILHQISNHLERNNLTNPSQYGFTKSRSVSSLLLDLYDKLRLNLNSGKLSIIILLDYSKAFDTVSHDKILHKLYEIGFSYNSICFMISFLRKRFVSLDNFEEEVLSGVPQGSILGPLLFNIYVSEFSKQFPNAQSVFQFADDSQIVLTFKRDVSFESIIASINNTLHIAKTWSINNNLVLNEAKTKVLPIFNKNSTFSKMPFFNNTDFPYFTQAARNLGVTFNHHLNWTNHFIEMNSAFCKSFYPLRQFFKCFTVKSDTQLRKNIVFTVLFPKITFCIPLFFRHSQKCTAIWNSIIRRLASLVTNRFCRTADSLDTGFNTLEQEIKQRVIAQLNKKKIVIPQPEPKQTRSTKIPLPPIDMHDTFYEYVIVTLNAIL